MSDFDGGGWRLDLEHPDEILAEAAPNAPCDGDVEIIPVTDPFARVRMENQARESSCTAHATTTVAEWCYEIASGGKETEFSRQYLYVRTRQRDGIRGDNGSTIGNAVKQFMQEGLCEESLWPYTGEDVWNPPSSTTWDQCNANAAGFKGGQYVPLSSYGDVLQWCARGRGGVVFGLNVNRAFSSCTGVLETYARNSGGGHALCWLWPSPRQNSRGEHYMWGPNSWGTSWGNRGWAEYSPDYIQAVCDASRFGTLGLTDMATIVDRKLRIHLDW